MEELYIGLMSGTSVDSVDSVLVNLANQILDNIFGENDDQQNNGETIIGDYKVVWTSTDDPDDVVGVTVVITNTITGEVVYSYGFPYQETE